MNISRSRRAPITNDLEKNIFSLGGLRRKKRRKKIIIRFLEESDVADVR